MTIRTTMRPACVGALSAMLLALAFPAQAQDKKVVFGLPGIPPIFTTAQPYVAQQEGFFKKNGANVYYGASSTFAVVFDDPAASTRSIGYLINNLSTSAEAQWVVAMLNATKMSGTFPYSTAEVLALYKNTSARTAALAFFQTYLGGA